MSRERNPHPMRLTVTVDLICQRCGGDLTSAVQHRGQHPRAGESYLDGRGAELVEGPNGEKKVRATCSRCGAQPQVKWSRVVEKLDGLDETGPHGDPFPI